MQRVDLAGVEPASSNTFQLPTTSLVLLIYDADGVVQPATNFRDVVLLPYCSIISRVTISLVDDYKI